MRYSILIIAITITEFLVGCTKCPRNYLTHTQIIPAMKSTSALIKRGDSYCPIPNSTLSVTQLPSLIPPGSHLNTLKKKFNSDTKKRNKIVKVRVGGYRKLHT